MVKAGHYSPCKACFAGAEVAVKADVVSRLKARCKFGRQLLRLLFASAQETKRIPYGILPSGLFLRLIKFPTINKLPQFLLFLAFGKKGRLYFFLLWRHPHLQPLAFGIGNPVAV
jgi:hypothetical protein